MFKRIVSGAPLWRRAVVAGRRDSDVATVIDADGSQGFAMSHATLLGNRDHRQCSLGPQRRSDKCWVWPLSWTGSVSVVGGCAAVDGQESATLTTTPCKRSRTPPRWSGRPAHRAEDVSPAGGARTALSTPASVWSMSTVCGRVNEARRRRPPDFIYTLPNGTSRPRTPTRWLCSADRRALAVGPWLRDVRTPRQRQGTSGQCESARLRHSYSIAERTSHKMIKALPSLSCFIACPPRRSQWSTDPVNG